MTPLRWASLACALVAVFAPMAHVLEAPNKLALDGPLWLAVQQHLYRGWGPLLGGPVELGALAASVALLWRRRRDGPTFWPTLLAALAYGTMVATFFVFNRPVNAALNAWTAATLPVDWASYRIRWEAGHALSAALSIVGLISVVRACLLERDRLR